jgi:hypothetical protein
MESKKINQLATAVSPSTSDLAIIGDPVTGVSKKITWLQVSTLIGTAANLQQVTDNGATTTNPIAIGGLTITGLSTGVLKSDSGVISSVPFGAANGVATLAGDGKVPSNQLPSYVDDVVEVANYAALPVTGETGKIYITLDNNKVYRWGGSVYVEVAANQAVWGSITGTLVNQTDLQSALDAKVPTSRTITINGTSYDLSANRTWSVGTLTSVGLTMPSGFSVASSPLTGAGGTIAVTGAGNSTQYIDGSGSLQTFPTLLSSDNLVKLVRNQSGATMTAGTIVYISGATGNKPLITKAIATGDATSAQTFGLVQSSIANNADGYVVIIGNIGDLDTSALTEGQQLYLSGTTAGAYTTTKPYAPIHLVYVGIVLRSHPNQGIIGVKIQNGYEMDELHNVDAQSPSNNDILSYNTTTSLWEHKQIATTLGFTPISLASLSAVSPLIYNNGTGAFSIQVATASQNGYLSSTDWSTFNNKQAALGGTGFVKISGSTISYDNSTYYLASNPSGFITLASLSAGAGISYSNITGVISSTITQYTDALARAAISSSATGLTYTSATGVFSLTAGYAIPTTAKQTNWDTAYNDSIISAAVSGTTTKTLTLTQQDAGTITASWTDINTDAVSSVFGRTGAVIAVSGDYNTDQVTEGVTNLYYTNSRSRLALSFVAGSGAYNSTTGVITIPTNNTQITNGAGYITGNQTITLSGDVAGSGTTAITTTIGALKVTNAMLAGSIDLTTKVTGLLPDANISSAATWNAKQAALNGTGFVKATGTTISYDNSTYLTTTSAASTYLPLVGGTLTGDLTITRAAITASSVNSTDTGLYSYFSNQENGVLKTYFLYLNSLFVDVDRRETLEIRNQVGKITLYTAGILGLTIDTTQNSTFAKSLTLTNGVLTINNGGAAESFVVNAGSTGNAIGVRTRTGNDYAFFNWRSINGSELLAESYIQRTAASTAILRHTINNGTSPAIYQTIYSTGGVAFNSLSGTGTRMVVADANGLLSTQAIGGGSVSGSGTNNKVAKFTSTGSTIGDSIITATANEVTITSTLVGPIFVLEQLTANQYSQMQFKGDTKHAYIFKGNSTYASYGGVNALNFYTDSEGGGGFAFHPANITNAVYIDNTGKLGLNVGVSPTNLLHLAGASATPSLRLGSVSSGYHWDIGRENATTGDFLFNYTNAGTLSGTFARITTAGLFGIGVTPSGTYGKLSVAGGIRTIDDNNSKLELGRYSSGNPDSYIKLGANSNRLIISKKDDSADLFYFSNTGKFGIGIDPTLPLHVSAASGYMANFTNGTNSLKVYCGSSYSILEGNSNNQMGWLGSAFYIEAGSTPVNRFNISAAGLTTITGELTLTGSSTHMNIISDTSYAYTRYQGGAQDMYLLQNLPAITSNGVAAGAAYFYMSNSQNFEFVWSAVSKIQFTSTGQATFAGDVIAFSDISVKENIRSIDNALDRIVKSRGVLYDRKDTKTKDNIGFIAQELELEFPELISVNNDGTKGVKYQNAVAVLFEAIKEQQKQINDLKKEIS